MLPFNGGGQSDFIQHDARCADDAGGSFLKFSVFQNNQLITQGIQFLLFIQRGAHMDEYRGIVYQRGGGIGIACKQALPELLRGGGGGG
ncbi:hypothetical protein NQ012_03160 [Neisseria dentiae]|nr:hypothetical protein [Neisseria dentiae]MCQ9325951.1 hypothetical protein [Neisseria dentiae]